MTRGPLAFKETDLVRAIKSAVKARLRVIGAEVNPRTGNIVIHAEKAEAANDNDDSWDKALGRGEDH